jgi:hypothetical protein
VAPRETAIPEPPPIIVPRPRTTPYLAPAATAAAGAASFTEAKAAEDEESRPASEASEATSSQDWRPASPPQDEPKAEPATGESSDSNSDSRPEVEAAELDRSDTLLLDPEALAEADAESGDETERASRVSSLENEMARLLGEIAGNKP